MPSQLTEANRLTRFLGDRRFQLDQHTVTLQMQSPVAALPSFPILRASTTTPSASKKFNEPVILISCYLSTTFHGTGIDETAAVAIARVNSSNANISLLGDSEVFLQQTFDATAATPAGTEINRNTGVTFPAPFFPLIQVGAAITIFGSSHTVAGLSYYTTATIYYLRVQELLGFQQFGG